MELMLVVVINISGFGFELLVDLNQFLISE